MPSSLFAQRDSTLYFNLSETPLTIDLYEEEEDEEDDVDIKIKRKKNVFYGLKTKKGFTKTGFGEKTVIETFHYLKEDKQIDPYVRDIYWYSFEDGRIHRGRNVDPKDGVLLHGPYRKFLSSSDQTLEEGIFYRGMKHGRWVRLNTDNILQDKEKYFKGWPKESKVAYYDRDRKKLREVIPVEYGDREGYYYYFHENGQLAVMGEYKFDHKVGVWREYYPYRRGRKKEIQYRPENDVFMSGFRPYVLREWNQEGKVIYDRSR